VTVDDGTDRFLRVNRDELRTVGLELAGSAEIAALDLTASVTVQSAELTDTDVGASNRPENLPEVFGDLGARAPLPAGLVARARLSYTGEQFVIDGLTGEDSELPARGVIDLALSRIWPMRMSWGPGSFRHLETRVAVENVADVARYDAWGLPEPGRRLRVELRIR